MQYMVLVTLIIGTLVLILVSIIIFDRDLDMGTVVKSVRAHGAVDRYQNARRHALSLAFIMLSRVFLPSVQLVSIELSTAYTYLR